MSKLATVAMSLTFTSSDEPDMDQIDFGPFISNATIGNSNSSAGIAGANTISPAIMGETGLSVGNNSLAAGPFVTPNVYPMYFGLLPIMQTGGTLTVQGANADTGVQVSSVNPSFIPIAAGLGNGGFSSPPANGIASVVLAASQTTIIKFFWA